MLRRARQKDCFEFQASAGYGARPYLKFSQSDSQKQTIKNTQINLGGGGAHL